MVKSKLYEEAIRSFSYGLAHDLLDHVISSFASSDSPSTTPIPSPSDSPSRIQTSLSPLNSEELLSKKLEEKEEVIRQLRVQLETLQRQMDSLQKGNITNHPGKRKLRSLHQIHGEVLKVTEENADSHSEKGSLSPKTSLEMRRSQSKDASTPIIEKPVNTKTPSLRDLHLPPASDSISAPKVNIFNVEYEEFSQQLKLELAPKTPGNPDKTNEEMASPEFRQKETKPVMNWSNLQSPRDTSVISLQTDSLALKEAETAVNPEPDLIYKHIPQQRKQSKPSHSTEKEINLSRKVRAKSQSHASKQTQSRPSDEVLRKGDNHTRSPRSAGIARTRTSIKEGKKTHVTPRSADRNNGKMNQTTSSFPSSDKETKSDLKGSSSYRSRKYNSRSHLGENKSSYKGRQVLDELLYNEDMCDQKAWNGIMKKMKENPSLLSRLLNQDMEEEEKVHSESTGSGLGEHRRVFTKVKGSGEGGKQASVTPVKAILPITALERRLPEVSNRDLNCVIEEDEDSSRSHFDPLPELYQTKPSNFRASSLPPKQHRSSVPKSRALQTNKEDWCESSLDSFVLGGNSDFNWDRRPGIFTEREIDVSYLRLHGNELEPNELKGIFSKAKNTALRLMNELMLQNYDYCPIPLMSIEGAISLLKQIKKMLQFRKLTMNVLNTLHQREDLILTLMSLDEEASPEREESTMEIGKVNKLLLGLISQWRHSGFPFKTFIYLNVVRPRQDYAEKILEESGEWLARNEFAGMD